MASPRILVVEDEPIVSLDLQESLTMLGYQVVGIADTGRKALRLAEQTSPDLAIMDIQIKGEINGIATASEIRRQFQIPVVFLTAFTDETSVQWAKQASPAAFLAKPFRIEELNATIVVALQQDRLIRDLFAERSWLTSLLEGVSEGIIATDVIGSVRFLNPPAQELTGWSAGEARDRGIEEIVGGQDPDSPLRQSISSAGAINARRAVLRARTGREIPVEASATPIVVSGYVAGAVTVLRHISQKHEPPVQIEKGFVQVSEESRAIAKRLLTMQEDERRRVARELHDDLCQRLAAYGMETSLLLRHLDDPRGQLLERISELAARIGNLAEELHGISRQIHPAILNDLGLAAAIGEECRGLSRRTGGSVHFESQDVPHPIPPDVSLCIFRVAQEALRNIGKHANASQVRVRLERAAAGISLSVEDAGGGFDFNDPGRRGGLGLISMRERVELLHGQFEISSQPGEGTRVEISVPLMEAC